MQQYQNVLREILADGVRTPNRTGVDTIKLDGAMMRFNLEAGFPAVTSKKLAFKSVAGELCGFLRASKSAADFRALGCKVWDANANDPGLPGSPNAWLMNAFRQGEDDLGPIYGAQWREWQGFKFFSDYGYCLGEITQAESMGWEVLMRGKQGDQPDAVVMYKEIDQLGDCVRTIIKSPNDRRILFHGWNPAVLDQVALPACHLLYHFLPNTVTGRLNMIIYVRSNDADKGTPFNIAEAALLMEIVAHLTGFKAGRLTYFVGDMHLYVNSLDYIKELLTKEPLPSPTLSISPRVWKFPDNPAKESLDQYADIAIQWLKQVEPSDFELVNYQHHALETVPAKMVV